MVARNDEMSLPIYVGSFKQCCNFINKRSNQKVNESQIFKQFNEFKKEVEVTKKYIIVQTELEQEEKTKKEVLLETKDIKYALKNYHKIKEMIRLDLDEIEALEYKMTGLGGGSIIQMDKGGNEVGFDRTSINSHLSEKIDALEKIVSENTYYLQVAQEFIKWVDNDKKMMIIDKYIKRLSVFELEIKYFYARQHILRIINELIEQFVEEM